MATPIWVKARGVDREHWLHTHLKDEQTHAIVKYSSLNETGTPAYLVERETLNRRHTYLVQRGFNSASITYQVTVDAGIEELRCDCGAKKHRWVKPCIYAGAVMRHLGLLRVDEDWAKDGLLPPKTPAETPRSNEPPPITRTFTTDELARSAKKNKGGRPKKEPRLAPDAVRHAPTSNEDYVPMMPATPREAVPSMQQAIRDGYYPVALRAEDGSWNYTICKSIAERNELMRSNKPTGHDQRPRTGQDQMPLEAIADAAWRLRDKKPLTPDLVEAATTPKVRYGDPEYGRLAKRIFNAQEAWKKILREVHYHDAHVEDSSWSPPGSDPAAPQQGIGRWIITKRAPTVT